MLSLSYLQLSFTSALILLLTGTHLDAKSIIVDDADTKNIIYSPGWIADNNCTGCLAQPDKSQTFGGGTWHDATSSGNGTDVFFTFTFTGTSVEARYIALDIVETAFVFTTGTNISYSIDGGQRGTTVRNPGNLNTYAYNQILFNVTGLTNTEHILRVDLLKPSVLLLDYLVYDDDGGVGRTTSRATRIKSSTSLLLIPTPTSTASTYASSGPSTNLGPIVGGVVAAVFVLVLGAVFIWYLRKRRGRQIPLRGAPILESEDNDPPLPRYLPSSAQPMSVAAIIQAGQTFKQPQPVPGHTATNASSFVVSNPSTDTVTGTSLAPTLPSSLASTNHSRHPSISKAHQGRHINAPLPVGTPRYSVQGSATGGAPPSSFHNEVVGSSVQAQTSDEQVEAGLMTRQPSRMSTLPPYSPGEFRRGDGVPRLPD